MVPIGLSFHRLSVVGITSLLSVASLSVCNIWSSLLLQDTSTAVVSSDVLYGPPPVAADILQRHGVETPTRHQELALTTTLPPCRILVTNSVPWHKETLESIARFLPLRYVDVDTTTPWPCSAQQTVLFDYHSRPCHKQKRSHLCESWQDYFYSGMKGQKEVTNGVTRIINDLIVSPGDELNIGFNNKHNNNNLMSKYHARIEATCSCNRHPHDRHNRVSSDNSVDKDGGNASLPAQTAHLLDAQPHTTCIFHEVCEPFESHPRSVWVSPFHKQYYLPTALPKIPEHQFIQHRPRSSSSSLRSPSSASSSLSSSVQTPLRLCVVGDSKRRYWPYIRHYFRVKANETSNSTTFPVVQVQVYGYKPPPEDLLSLNISSSQIPQLISFHDDTNITMDFVRFHTTIGTNCDIMTSLVKEHINSNYFDRPKSHLKLTGSLPMIVAYQLPSLLHEKLQQAYRPHLPLYYNNDRDQRGKRRGERRGQEEKVEIPRATHNETVESFAEALDYLVATMTMATRQPR